MSEEEYYSRMKKLDCRQMTDRTSRDEDFYIEHQRNYLSKQYIKTLQQENKQLKGILQEIYERAINTNITSLDFREYILEILGGKNGETN